MNSPENNPRDRVELAPVPGFFVPQRLVEAYSLPSRQVRILSALRRHWYLMVGSLLLCLAVAAIAVRVATGAAKVAETPTTCPRSSRTINVPELI